MMGDIQFRMTVPSWAADELLADPLIRAQVQTTTGSSPAARKDAFELGLAEAAQIMSLIVGSTKLAELAVQLAKKLCSLREEAQRRRQHLRAVVQTGGDDVILDIERFNADQLANVITRIASQE